MIKVVHITASLGFGGVERVVTSLCDNLDHNRFEVHIISLSNHIPLAAFLNCPDKVTIHTCGRPQGLSTFGLHFASTFRMYRILAKIKPDIIHSHLYYLNNLAYAVGKGIPHVITLHGPSIMALRNRARQLFFALVNFGRKDASYTIAVSNSVKDEIVKHFHSNFSSITVICNGIDTTFYKPDNKRNNNPPVVINIARHVHAKGIECLLHAWSIVCENHNATLQLVGDGPQHMGYKKIAADLKLEEAVQFLGSQTDVKSLMAHADFGVFPSETEGLPMAPAEMMAMELPVIGSDIPPLIELIGKAGDVVPVNNHETLAKKIIEYIENPEMVKQKGQKARKRIEEQFSLKQQVLKHEHFYQNIVEHA